MPELLSEHLNILVIAACILSAVSIVLLIVLLVKQHHSIRLSLTVWMMLTSRVPSWKKSSAVNSLVSSRPLFQLSQKTAVPAISAWICYLQGLIFSISRRTSAFTVLSPPWIISLLPMMKRQNSCELLSLPALKSCRKRTAKSSNRCE